MLDNPFYQDALELFVLQDMNFSVEDIKKYLSILTNITAISDNWKQISKIMDTVKNTFSCFDTNRFVAVENEVELEALATQLFKNATFLVGKLSK